MAHPLRVVAPLAVLFSLGCGPEATTAPTVPVSSSAAPTEPPPPPATPPDASPGPSADKTGTKTLYVRETRVDCEGEGPRKCLQVREGEGTEWTLFYSPIEGFTYEEGTKYELRVSVEKNPQPMADGGSLRYKLVEIVSKEKVQARK